METIRIWDLGWKKDEPGSETLDLTKVISILNYRGPRTDMSRPGVEPGPPRWEASTLE
jgi:hypothetical protein